MKLPPVDLPYGVSATNTSAMPCEKLTGKVAARPT